MFILYAVVLGLMLGLLVGGSPARLAQLRIRWSAAISGGLLIQVALFSTPLGNGIGDLAPWVYLASNTLVLGAVLRNAAVPGLWLVLAGGLSNVTAIVANGGYMPVSADALATMGRVEQVGYSNSRHLEDVVLGPLTDIFAMPTWIPAANVFSVGDVLIGIGVATAIVATMRAAGTTPALGGEVGAPAH